MVATALCHTDAYTLDGHDPEVGGGMNSGRKERNEPLKEREGKKKKEKKKKEEKRKCEGARLLLGLRIGEGQSQG
jgi:hypothetical protein